MISAALLKLITCSFTSKLNDCTRRKSGKEPPTGYRSSRAEVFNFFKKDSGTGVSLWICEISKKNFFTSQNNFDGCFCRYLKIQFSSHTARSSRSQIFFKISVLVRFVMFTRKRLYCSFILVKLQALTLLEKTPTQVFSCEYWKIFKNNFFYRTLLVAASVMHSEAFYKIPVECWFLMWRKLKFYWKSNPLCL